MSSPLSIESSIAVIGVAGRFPGASNVGEFWRNLREGRETIRFFDTEVALASGADLLLVQEESYVRAWGVLDDIDRFDAPFFGFTPREAELTDPQQRLFLECVHEALENAACNPDAYPGLIGVYAGMSTSTYVHQLYAERTFRELSGMQIQLGTDKDFLPTRVSYKLNLRGPSVAVGTACSTSLVAVSLACQGLLAYACDVAIAGGSSIEVPQTIGYLHEEGGINSPDGHCRPFDALAQGTVGGSGVAAVVLKRLQDAIDDRDHIYAVVRGCALNNDGAAKVGYTAPSVGGQAEVIVMAQSAAGITPADVGYIEAHGTATPLGDPIEIAALARVFGESGAGSRRCPIGSVKSNVGHLDAAAGVTGFIKTVLALHHEEIPPSLHYTRPNPKLEIERTPFVVNAELRPWRRNGAARIAGVSSFGVGGTNAHVVLQEAPVIDVTSAPRPAHLVVVSARTPSALATATRNLARHLETHPDQSLADVAYTTQIGRRAFAHRLFAVSGSAKSAIDQLDPATYHGRVSTANEGHRPVAFVFSGQGAQYVDMGRGLYETEPVFRACVDECCELAGRLLGDDLRSLVYPNRRDGGAQERLNETAVTQPALFMIEYALATLWRTWGVEPSALLGHSVGEYAAACVAGVLSLADAIRLVVCRGRLMQRLDRGRMLAVEISEAAALRQIPDAVSIAAVNAPSWVVLSGEVATMDRLERQWKAENINVRPLKTSHAFHSAMMDPILDEFRQEVARTELRAPAVPYVSCLTGRWMTPDECTNPDYWVRHTRHTVRFADAAARLVRDPAWTFIEVGPGRSLLALIQACAGSDMHTTVPSMRASGENTGDSDVLLESVGQLWGSGVAIDWEAFQRDRRPRRLAIPTYPFERQSYWIGQTSDPSAEQVDEEAAAPAVSVSETTEEAVTRVWKDVLGIDTIGLDDNFFDLGGFSVSAIQMVTRLRRLLGVDLHLNSLFAQPTIRGLSRQIERIRMVGNAGSLIVVPIQAPPNSVVPPLFCVHPIGGGVFNFIQLARHLGPDQPVYGVQAVELADIGAEGDPYASLNALAHDYLEAIRTIQPVGPYLLSGLSWGGIVAFEMAQQLVAAGEDVALLAMLDTPSPLEVAKVDRFTDTEILVGLARDLGFQQNFAIPITVQSLQRLSRPEQYRQIVSELRRYHILTGETDEAWLDRHLQGYRSRIRLVASYTPGIYPGAITLFKAASQDEELVAQLERAEIDFRNPTFAWDHLSAKPIQVYDVPGIHSNIAIEPNVGTLARLLSQCIADATSRRGAFADTV